MSCVRLFWGCVVVVLWLSCGFDKKEDLAKAGVDLLYLTLALYFIRYNIYIAVRIFLFGM